MIWKIGQYMGLEKTKLVIIVGFWLLSVYSCAFLSASQFGHITGRSYFDQNSRDHTGVVFWFSLDSTSGKAQYYFFRPIVFLIETSPAYKYGPEMQGVSNFRRAASQSAIVRQSPIGWEYAINYGGIWSVWAISSGLIAVVGLLALVFAAGRYLFNKNAS